MGFPDLESSVKAGVVLEPPAPLRWILEPEAPLSPDVLAIPGGDPAIGSEGQPAVAQNRPLSSLTGWKSHMEVDAARCGGLAASIYRTAIVAPSWLADSPTPAANNTRLLP